jgi:hypothetical protein
MTQYEKNRVVALALSLVASGVLAASAPKREKEDPAALDREDARKALIAFDAEKPHYAARNNRRRNASQFASLVLGAGSLWPLDARVMVWPFTRNLNILAQDDGPPQQLFMAIRAARRALEKNPKDYKAHFLLGEAYFRLSEHTSERAWLRDSSLGRLRSAQAIAAFASALRLKPDLAEAHARLATAFHALDLKDLQLEHLKAYLKFVRKRGPQSESQDQFNDRVAQIDRLVQAQEKALQQLQDRYAVNSVGLKILDRAMMASRLGLRGKALDILLASDIATFGIKGMEMELELLLHTGAADKVRAWMDPSHKELLGALKYHWYKARASAALGDYRAADLELQEMVKFSGFPGHTQKSIPLRTVIALAFADALLANSQVNYMVPLKRLFVPSGPVQELWEIAARLNHEADIQVLRGLLALESSQTKKAADLFDEALNFWNSPTGVALRDIRPHSARRLADHYRNLIKHFKAGDS